MPPLIRLLGAVPGAGFSTNRRILPSVIGGDDTEGRRIVDRDEMNGGLCRVASVEVDECGNVEIGQDVAVGDDERVVDPTEVGREPDGTGRVERLGLDRVAQRHPVALAARERFDERLRLESERERDLGDATFGEVVHQTFDDRDMPDGQHRFRCGQGEWT